MKTLALHVALLFVILWFGCRFPAPQSLNIKWLFENEGNASTAGNSPSSEVAQHAMPNNRSDLNREKHDTWRRTVDGWERREQWRTFQSREPVATRSWFNIAALHPLTWASLVIWLSVGALLLTHPHRPSRAR